MLKLLVETKGERPRDANNMCFTAQRPHRDTLAMPLVLCMAWSRQNLAYKTRKDMGIYFALLVSKSFWGQAKKEKTTK